MSTGNQNIVLTLKANSSVRMYPIALNASILHPPLPGLLVGLPGWSGFEVVTGLPGSLVAGGDPTTRNKRT